MEETVLFFEEFDLQIKNASHARGHRFCLARDRTIVLMTVFGVVQHVLDKCRNQAHDGLLVPKVFENGICSNATNHLAWYLGFIIDDWGKFEPDLPRFVFPSRKNTPIHLESIRNRAGVIKKNAGLTDITSCIEALSL
ncbi:hypothetical protein AAKU61_003838 [Undibacterium sp. GrIS 1.2]